MQLFCHTFILRLVFQTSRRFCYVFVYNKTVNKFSSVAGAQFWRAVTLDRGREGCTLFSKYSVPSKTGITSTGINGFHLLPKEIFKKPF